MNILITTIIRNILSLLLIFGVYTETGIYTALAIFLITLRFELPVWMKFKEIYDV